jgi:YD repeat-containing protein
MGDGETVEYTYGGIGKSDLQQVTTRLASGQLLRQVSYTYDNHGRMTSVTVNLDPGNEIPDDRFTQQTYTTRYTYDDTTNRVLTITQSDGTSLAFTYVRTPDNVYRVATVTDGDGQVTRFSYDIETRTTVMTDPLGVSTVFQYDVGGQLTQVRTGVTASSAAGLSSVSYAYDALGNVVRMTDGLGNTVTLEYDSKGNLTRQVDAEGNTLVKTYDARNQVLTETMYASVAAGTAPSQPQTTRHVYEADGNNLLRFVVSP